MPGQYWDSQWEVSVLGECWWNIGVMHIKCEREPALEWRRAYAFKVTTCYNSHQRWEIVEAVSEMPIFWQYRHNIVYNTETHYIWVRAVQRDIATCPTLVNAFNIRPTFALHWRDCHGHTYVFLVNNLKLNPRQILRACCQLGVTK